MNIWQVFIEQEGYVIAFCKELRVVAACSVMATQVKDILGVLDDGILS